MLEHDYLNISRNLEIRKNFSRIYNLGRSLFLWSTNAHFCLQFQELFKSDINSELIKITSHPEVFSRLASETRNQSRNKKGMITWVRASCT